jgi:hypothetical protein
VGRVRPLLGLCALAVAMCWQAAASADAANSPTFRDCSLAAGIDPDFVQLTGVSVGPGGSLIVSRGQPQVSIEASESSDPGDNLGHVTLDVKVSSPKQPTIDRSGAGTGKVVLSIPLERSTKVGRSYTISWADTTDNGNHACPSTSTPENTTPMPFVVTVQKAKNYTYCAFLPGESECFPGPFEVFRKTHTWNWKEVEGEVSGTFTVTGKHYVFREAKPESRDEFRGTKRNGIISGKLYENGAPSEFTFTLTPR